MDTCDFAKTVCDDGWEPNAAHLIQPLLLLRKLGLDGLLFGQLCVANGIDLGV